MGHFSRTVSHSLCSRASPVRPIISHARAIVKAECPSESNTMGFYNGLRPLIKSYKKSKWPLRSLRSADRYLAAPRLPHLGRQARLDIGSATCIKLEIMLFERVQ